MSAHSRTQQWVVVTGGASGIGEGVAKTVAAAGYGVILVDLDEKRLAEVASTLPAARIVATDITSPEAAALLEDAARDVGNAWGLVNCAGVALVKHFLLNSEEEWTRVLRVNLEGTFRATHAVGTVLADNGGGAIVNIASISGVTPAAVQAAYAASKAGVIGFTTSVAFDFGPLNITINALCPGIVRTPIWERILEQESAETGQPVDELFARHLLPVPVGRAQTAEEIGKAVLFLVSDDARSITGASLNISGGMTTVVLDHIGGAAEFRASRAFG